MLVGVVAAGRSRPDPPVVLATLLAFELQFGFVVSPMQFPFGSGYNEEYCGGG